MATAAAIVVAALLPYVGAVRGGFVFDDHSAIVGNPVVQEDLDPVRLLRSDMWGRDRVRTHGSYRPLTVLSFAADGWIGGGEPWSFHATNLLLHGLVTLLAFVVLSRRVGETAATMAALLFAVHALHTENVAGIVGRADVLAALLGLGAWWAWETRRVGPGVGAGLLVFLGLLAHEVTVAFLVVLCWETAVTFARRDVRLHVARIGAAFAALAGYVVLRFWALGLFAAPVGLQSNPLVDATVPERVWTAASLLARSVGLMLAPVVLSADYSYAEIMPIPSPWRADVLLGLALLALLPVAAVALRRRRPAAAIGLVLFLAAYLPVANLFVLIPPIFAERLLYIPSLGFCVALAEPLAAAFKRSGRLTTAVLIVVVCGHGLRGAARTEDWRSQRSLFASSVIASPSSARAWFNLGVADLEEQEYRAAARRFSKAVSIAPQWDQAHSYLGIALDMSGRPADAHREFRRATVLSPTCDRCAVNLVRFYLKYRQRDRAAQALEAFKGAGGRPLTADVLEREIETGRVQRLDGIFGRSR